jgi:hypothetical protein
MEESLISTRSPIFMAFTVLLKVKLKAGSNGRARRNIKVQKSLNGIDWGPPIHIYYEKDFKSVPYFISFLQKMVSECQIKCQGKNIFL